MKQYKHPKLGRTSKILDPTIGYQIYDDKGKKFESMSHPYSPRELVHLGFEEVGDEKEITTYGSDCNITTNEVNKENDRIDKAFSHYKGYYNEYEAKEKFRMVIMQFMPKRKKFTDTEVKLYIYDNGLLSTNYALILKNFLRDHDLLEE